MAVLGISQAGRMGKLHTPLGADTLALLRFMGTDGVNELFEYEVEAISSDPNINFDDLIGTDITVELETISSDSRFFNGVVTNGMWAGVGDTGNKYVMTLRPWFWLLSKRRNQKIYHEKTVEDILSEVLNEHGVQHELNLTKSYSPMEYTVQYRESDLHFLCRMMERHGINYYFKHDNGSNKLVMCDSHDGWDEVPSGSIDYHPVDAQHLAEGEHFWNWMPRRTFTTGKIRQMDYNFKKPSQAMDSEATGDAAYMNGQIESYDYPGIYLDKGEGTGLSQLRMDQERSADKHHSATGDTMSLSSGMKFTLEGQHDAGLTGKEYVCLRASHSFVSEGYGTGQSLDEKHAFVGNYEMSGTDVPHAPERKTHDTRISGPQTAMVVGNGEVDCDEHGRILVKFHWDDKSAHSMRVRCQQVWAHNGYGAQFIPRIGMEVVVIFIEGDPNQPLVTGCVYHGENKPELVEGELLTFSDHKAGDHSGKSLPGDKNWSGLRTNSIGGGGFNELMFNDTPGKELLRQHAQFDMETKVLNDERREIDNNRSTWIGNDELRTVENNEEHVIGVDQTWEVGQNVTWTIGNNQTYNIGNNCDWTIGMNESREIGASRSTKIGANEEVEVGVSRDTKIGVNDTLEVGVQKTIKANAGIKFQVGPNSIEITPAGITIKGIMVNIEAQAMLTTKGTMATHEGAAMMTIKGGIVLIN